MYQIVCRLQGQGKEILCYVMYCRLMDCACVMCIDILCEPAILVSDGSSALLVGDETWFHGVRLSCSWFLNTARQSLRYEIIQTGLFCYDGYSL